MESLLTNLEKLRDSDMYPCHMPGHKRMGNSLFGLDITEIDEFDNLYHATGILKEAKVRAAKLYKTKESYYLVNGSTCGILIAIFSAFMPGDTIIVARNCHKAVYHAIEIRGLRPIFIYPETDGEYDISVGIKTEQVKEILEQNQGQIKGMILTSPTYEGIVSEIGEIADLIHIEGGILIVDEAHGAHFGFDDRFPESAVKQGADLVIQSLHKTLPSMTQTALLHRVTDRVDRMRVNKYLSTFQTTSPSYIFMATMDDCIRTLSEKKESLFLEFYKKLTSFYNKCRELKCVHVRNHLTKYTDPGKIVIKADGMSGKELYHYLREEYHLQPEMCSGNYALAIMTISDTKEGFERLIQALRNLDDILKERADAGFNQVLSNSDDMSEERADVGFNRERNTESDLSRLLKHRPERKYYPDEVENCDAQLLTLEEAEGRISKDYIYLYPPGIPFLIPGEVLDDKLMDGLLKLNENGYKLTGMSDESCDKILVLKQDSN